MNLTLTERDKKLLGLTACLAILAIFGVHLIRPALAEQEALGGEYEAALRKQQEYQAQIDARAALDDSIAQNEAALKTAGEPYYPGGLETRQMDDIITGLALYAQSWGWDTSWMAWFGWVFVLFGDALTVRTVHHVMMYVFILFSIAHIYMSFREDVMGGATTLSSMSTGLRMFKEDHHG